MEDEITTIECFLGCILLQRETDFKLLKRDMIRNSHVTTIIYKKQ